MKFYHTVLYQLILLPAPLMAGAYSPILEQLQPNSITIIGEIHQHPESIKLFQELINGYLKNNKCLTVALEIPSNQQETIDQIKQGSAVVSDIEISPIIDHSALRDMISVLVNQQRSGACLNIIAIDAGDDVAMRRDDWMTVKLGDAVGNTPVLALLGGLHALKKVKWDLSATRGLPFVAELLTDQGYRVNSYTQHFPDADCSDKQPLRYRFIAGETKEALVVLNNSFFSFLNADVPEAAIEVVDGVVVWECEK